MNAQNLSEITAFQLFITDGIYVQVITQLSQLTNPLTASLCMRAVNFEPIQWLLEALVREMVADVLETTWTRLTRPYNTLYARFAVAFPTAGHLIRLAEDE